MPACIARQPAVVRRSLLLSVPLLLVLPAAAKPAAAQIEAPPGTYMLEKTHASLTWRVDHMGMSRYTARFTRFDATLQFDPAKLERSSVEVSIDVASIETDYPSGLGGRDWNQELRGPEFFNSAQFPKADFRSTRVTRTGPRTLRIDGELRFLGVTQPVTLNATLNGSTASHPFAKVPALGFSANGKLKRTAFGLNPQPIQQGVSDEVELAIEAEFLRQP